jgi:hypothetical protein
MQQGYEPLIRSVGDATTRELDRLCSRYTASGDPRDVLAARDSLKAMLCL